jgi:hypothetical protein
MMEKGSLLVYIQQNIISIQYAWQLFSKNNLMFVEDYRVFCILKYHGFILQKMEGFFNIFHPDHKFSLKKNIPFARLHIKRFKYLQRSIENVSIQDFDDDKPSLIAITHEQEVCFVLVTKSSIEIKRKRTFSE